MAAGSDRIVSFAMILRQLVGDLLCCVRNDAQDLMQGRETDIKYDGIAKYLTMKNITPEAPSFCDRVDAVYDAVSQISSSSGSSSGSHYDRKALAVRIDAICSEDQITDKHAALRELMGTGGPVEPLGTWSIIFTVGMVFVDILLDLSTINTFTANEDVWFAICLNVTFVYSMTSQVVSGRLPRLLQEMRKSAEDGKWTDGVLEVLDDESSVEGVVSLLVSCYGLPFSVKTPLQAMLGIFSVASGFYGMGNYLFKKLDLEGSWAEEDMAEEEQESETALLQA